MHFHGCSNLVTSLKNRIIRVSTVLELKAEGLLVEVYILQNNYPDGPDKKLKNQMAK